MRPLEHERQALALSFLQEVVYESRAKQAAGAALARGGSTGSNCGLGERAALELGLSARGGELFERLWPQGLAAAAGEVLKRELAAWVESQDAFDRRRNHFLRDFRHQHGFDRTRYSAEQGVQFERGLEQVNGEADAARVAAARRLLELA